MVLFLSHRIFFCAFVIGVQLAATYPTTPTHPEETGPHFEGDIIFPLTPFAGIIDRRYRWDNKVVPYEFERGYSQNLQDTFLKAASHISKRTCIRFKPRSVNSPEKDYIYVTGSTASCYSYVGKVGGRQTVSLPSRCNRFGTFVHELLHTVGFHHEQSRTDRDDFVQILWDNISPGKESNFRKYGAASVTSFGVPYDYDSVLHYSANAFSRDARLQTILTMDPNALSRIGQRNGMSTNDVEKVNRMYECDL